MNTNMKELNMDEMAMANGGSITLAVIGVIVCGGCFAGIIALGEDSAKKRNK